MQITKITRLGNREHATELVMQEGTSASMTDCHEKYGVSCPKGRFSVQVIRQCRETSLKEAKAIVLTACNNYSEG